MNDKELRQLVIDELDFDPSIDAADIGVAAENGVVTLTGHVPTYVQKVAAEHSAWRVKGVKGIAQKIEVRFPASKKHGDDEIAQRALNILAWNVVVPRDRIRVKVSDGWVTLAGTVDWNYQRVAAEKSVRKLGGVKGVFNGIGLESNVDAVDVRQHIRDALKRHAEVKADDVNVDVHDDGTVRIGGRVDNWDELQAVKRAVWSVPGVRSLDDHLVVG